MVMIIPYHVGIIPDGNRRFGKKYGLSLSQAYEKGIEKLREVCEWSKEIGIKILTVWGFSTENFNRKVQEKVMFFLLLHRKVKELLDSAKERRLGFKIKLIGRIDWFPWYLRNSLKKLESLSKEGELQLNIALGYGGRQEIIEAVNQILKTGKKRVTEEEFSKFLWLSESPDLIIRTSGEQRLSGFLPWQSTYSEFVFLKPLWPELTKKDFLKAIREFGRRQRRFGK